MLTIKTKQIDGYTIIMGAGQLSVCNESTKKANAAEIFELPESVEMRKKSQEKTAHIAAAGHHKKVARFYIPDKNNKTADPKKFKEHDDKYKLAAAAIPVCDSELKTMTPGCVGKAKDILRSKPIYNAPNTGEYISAGLNIIGPDGAGGVAVCEQSELESFGVIVDVDALIEKYLACPAGKLCDISGAYLPDYRGKEIWFKDAGNWMQLDLVKLGVDISEGDILYENLTEYDKAEVDAKKETYRIENLSDTDRAAEYSAKITDLQKKCALDATVLQLEGMTNTKALTESKAVYEAGVDSLKIKYSITGD